LTLTGQDPSYLPGAHFQVVGAEQKLPYKADYFDIIICNDVLEHLTDPAKALRSMARVLKPNGIIYINTPHLNGLRKAVFARPDELEHHISLQSFETLAEAVSQAKLHMLDHWTYTTLPTVLFARTPKWLGHEQACVCTKSVSGRQDSNLRPHAPKARTLAI
jgi:SAM-dependent methyltransferase